MFMFYCLTETYFNIKKHVMDEETLSPPAFGSYYFVFLLNICLFVTQTLIRHSVRILTKRRVKFRQTQQW